ncbi:MAG: glyoxalase/bleomycin resistance/dioxygenase family protein [Candidatus Aminicenantes bacterium]|nr:glyoxalase/bleomycin resistance/dioxygenase family protein [Candidatus Aminicenantes bacterium]
MKYICSLIVVEDVAKSRHLYESVLKQKVAADFGENIAFEGGFALHERDHYKALIGGRPIVPGSNAFELYFEDDDLEALDGELRAAGFEFVHDLEEQPWRQKVLRFYDYDRNIVEVGERLEHTAYRLSLEGLLLEDISRITYLPVEKVKTAIAEYAGT